MSEIHRSSRRLEKLASQLDALLADEFSRKILTGSIMALGVKANPLRLAQFAGGLRELYGHTLHSMAPDDDVKACEWFRPETQDGRPTRRQRIRFSIQGGMLDETVEALRVDTAEIYGEILAVIDELSKFTHVRPDTMEISADDAENFACDAIATFVAFLHVLE